MFKAQKDSKDIVKLVNVTVASEDIVEISHFSSFFSLTSSILVAS